MDTALAIYSGSSQSGMKDICVSLYSLAHYCVSKGVVTHAKLSGGMHVKDKLKKKKRKKNVVITLQDSFCPLSPYDVL